MELNIITTENNTHSSRKSSCGVWHSIPFSSMKAEFCDILGLCHGVNEIFAPQGFYTAQTGSLALTFRDNLWSRLKRR